MTANDKVLGYIRTGVPYGLGAILAFILAHTGLDLRGPFQVALVAFAVPTVTNGYYAIVRIVEVKFPLAGVFLGFPKAPDYVAVANLWASLVRTGIPPIVGAAVFSVGAWIGSAFGLTIDAETQSGTIVIGVTIIEAVYYTAARSIVQKWPGSAWLLGGEFAPSYPAPVAAKVAA